MTTLTVLALAAIAVIAGFAILGSITNQTDGTEDVVAGGLTTVTAPPATSEAPATTATTSTTTSTTTTSVPTASRSDAIVIVANASGVGRSAARMTDALEAAGYTTAPVANSTGPRLEQSIIYYIEGDTVALAVARLLAEDIPTAQTRPMPSPPPLDRPLNGATVALLLGRDAAGRSLADLQNG